MKFKYRAKTKIGEDQVGFVEAGSKEAALNILTGHELFVLSVESVEKAHWYDSIADIFSRVRQKDLMVFTRQLSILMEARIPLGNLLSILYKQTSQPILKEAVREISEDIGAGLSFSQALERQSSIFPSIFVSVIRSAEVVGNLENATAFLADYIEKEYNLTSKARSAMVYPALILTLFIVVSFIVIGFVLPQIEPIFSQTGVALPLFTRILISIGNFLNNFWFIALTVLIFLIAILLNYLQTPEGRAFKDDLQVRTPLLDRIYLPIVVSRVANTSSMLLKGGVPLVQTLEISAESVNNVIYNEILHSLAENVRQGKTLSASLLEYPDYFPELVSQVIAVGETTGQIDKAMERLFGFYSREVDSIINNLTDLIQPVLIIGIGILVGLLFASVLLPIYQLAGRVGSL